MNLDLNDCDSCPICGMPMVLGPSVDNHHLVPKLKGGKDTELMHVVCHRKLHSLWSENELRDTYNNVETILLDERIKKFIGFVRKQFSRNPEYKDSNKISNDHKKKRRK